MFLHKFRMHQCVQLSARWSSIALRMLSTCSIGRFDSLAIITFINDKLEIVFGWAFPIISMKAEEPKVIWQNHVIQRLPWAWSSIWAINLLWFDAKTIIRFSSQNRQTYVPEPRKILFVNNRVMQNIITSFPLPLLAPLFNYEWGKLGDIISFSWIFSSLLPFLYERGAAISVPFCFIPLTFLISSYCTKSCIIQAKKGEEARKGSGPTRRWMKSHESVLLCADIMCVRYWYSFPNETSVRTEKRPWQQRGNCYYSWYSISWHPKYLHQP